MPRVEMTARRFRICAARKRTSAAEPREEWRNARPAPLNAGGSGAGEEQVRMNKEVTSVGRVWEMPTATPFTVRSTAQMIIHRTFHPTSTIPINRHVWWRYPPSITSHHVPSNRTMSNLFTIMSVRPKGSPLAHATDQHTFRSFRALAVNCPVMSDNNADVRTQPVQIHGSSVLGRRHRHSKCNRARQSPRVRSKAMVRRPVIWRLPSMTDHGMGSSQQRRVLAPRGIRGGKGDVQRNGAERGARRALRRRCYATATPSTIHQAGEAPRSRYERRSVMRFPLI